MADTKITALTAISTNPVNPATFPIPMVDLLDTSMAASGTTKKVTVNQILGSGGTATLASATITGAATVGTTLGVTGASTLASATVTGLATVGTTFAVGTVTPDIFARFYTRSIGFDSSGSTVLQINGTSYGGVDLGAAGVRTFSLTSSASETGITTATNIPINFNINGVTKMTLNTAGNLAFVNGQGIDFSATSGTGTSELLNDYEEGTWTPTAGDASSGGNQATTATAVGRYTKIGRLVTVHFELTDINTTGLTAGNSMNVRGLPFAASNATTQFGTIAGAGITFTGFLTCGVYNGSAFPIYATSTAGSLADIKVSGFASGTADIFGTLTYFV